MKVKFLANIRDLADGEKEFSIERPTGASVRPLIDVLCAKFGENFREFCMDGDKISPRIHILVNGKHYAHLNGENTPIHENDEITIYPMIGGG